MTADQLIALVHERGVVAVAELSRNPASMLLQGMNLTAWTARMTPGAMFFTTDQEGEPDVLVLNAPESERARWEQLARESSTKATKVILLKDA